jgi:soluble lytic murein transglycosylase
MGRGATISASEPSRIEVGVAALGRGASGLVANRRPLARTCRRALVWLLASAMAAFGAANALSAPRDKQADRKKPAAAEHQKSGAGPAAKPGKAARPAKGKPTAHPAAAPPPAEQPNVAALPPGLAAVKQAIDLVRQGKTKDASVLAASLDDPVAVKLVEWARLRHLDGEGSFDRYSAFIHANPDWPSKSLRRRGEARLWREQRGAAAVRGFVGNEPISPHGQLALARAEMGDGYRADAQARVRAVWQSAPLSGEMEESVLAAFPGVLTSADHAARMDRRIGAKDFGAAQRAAKRAGDKQVAIVKACIAVDAKSAKGGALLDAVPTDARGDLGYALCRVQWLLRNDTPGSNVHGRIVTPKEDIAAAVKLVLAASPEDLARQDTDEWWRARRALARKLIDMGDAATAYQVVHKAAMPANPYYRADVHFMSGWIALRFLADPATALAHFANIDDGIADPIVLARAAYWRGRAAEAAGQTEEMQAQYQAAARYPTAYYGQLARARLGLQDVVLLRPPPEPADCKDNELLHAADILYQIGAIDLVRLFASDLVEDSDDAGVIAGLGELTARNKDAQTMLFVGKTALAKGLPVEQYAFPDIGVPSYTPVGPQLDRCIAYSIVRTESGFDQRDMSSAKAVGLMQVTPGAGRDTAKRFGVAYDWKRLVSDPAYNMQLGAGEVSALLKDYRGSFIKTFAGYNAGRGRVEQWVAVHGDPLDPSVDAVDWVERIPFAETRNYVQRVIENLQVYHARFGASTATTEPNLHRKAILVGRPARASAEGSDP